MTEPTRWRKSSRSQNDSACVEVANTLDMLRDSKDATGPILRVALGALIDDVKAGRLAR